MYVWLQRVFTVELSSYSTLLVHTDELIDWSKRWLDCENIARMVLIVKMWNKQKQKNSTPMWGRGDRRVTKWLEASCDSIGGKEEKWCDRWLQSDCHWLLACAHWPLSVSPVILVGWKRTFMLSNNVVMTVNVGLKIHFYFLKSTFNRCQEATKCWGRG